REARRRRAASGGRAASLSRVMASVTRTALVTGATGLVGTHIVERLLKDGWNVRALVRSSPAALPTGVEGGRGDVLEPEAFATAARGCDTIFHTAAVITPAGGGEALPRPQAGRTPHREGPPGHGGARARALGRGRR